MSEQDLIAESKKQGTDLVRVFIGVGGLVAFVVGLLIVFNPVATGETVITFVAIVLGVYLVVSGLIYLGTAIFSKTVSGWRRLGVALLGVLYLVAGIFTFMNLGATALVLAAFLSIFIGVTWIFEGVIAFTSLGAARSKVWNIIYGVISIIAGLVLILSPLLGAVTLWLLLGISMVILGVVQMVRAFTLKHE